MIKKKEKYETLKELRKSEKKDKAGTKCIDNKCTKKPI